MDPLEIILDIPRYPDPPRPRVRIPSGVRANALIALAVRATMPPSRRGMTDAGLETASKLATREWMSVEEVRKISRYFPRHEIDKSAPGWESWSKGRQAWMGWGGDEGWEWAADEAGWEVET